MCGICGIAGPLARAPKSSGTLSRMIGCLRHRGPDQEGSHHEPGVRLGQVRLSIVASGEYTLPVSSEDGRLTLVWNGQIYNHRELRHRLEQRGHVFRTPGDGEVILHLYEEAGEEGLRDLNGIFAWALWDREERRLVLARDRAGVKPLYYAPCGDSLVFGSELKALLEVPGFSRDVSPTALACYLRLFYVPDPLSIFSWAAKLPPGHLLTFSGGRIRLRRYWDLSRSILPEARRDPGEKEAAASFSRLLADAVRIRVADEKRVGIFLSGGLDSGSILSMIRRETGARPVAFSVGFREEPWNELPLAGRVARRFRAEWHHRVLTGSRAAALLPRIAPFLDEPFADSSLLPTWVVASMAREQGFKFVLNGDGGDELLGGYPYYRDPAYPSAAGRELRPADEAFRAEELPEGLRGAESRVMTAYAARLNRIRFRDRVQAFSYRDWTSYLPFDLLVKIDRLAMMHALEARSPFLDYRVAERLFSLPASLKVTENRAKYLLHRTVARGLPSPVRNLPKRGFGIPLARWLREPGRFRREAEEVLLDPAGFSRQLFGMPGLFRLLCRHEREGRMGARIFALCQLNRWQEHFGRG